MKYTFLKDYRLSLDGINVTSFKAGDVIEGGISDRMLDNLIPNGIVDYEKKVKQVEKVSPAVSPVEPVEEVVEEPEEAEEEEEEETEPEVENKINNKLRGKKHGRKSK